jgi:hypothetical protein
MEPMNDELFLFDRLWFPKVFKIARESGLDWLRMSAAAEVLSDGDPRKRVIDWDFINEFIPSDSPVFSAFYDENGQPSADLIDRGTRWGLFQIIGQQAIDFGHTGRLVNLIEYTKNIQVVCYMMVELINKAEQESKGMAEASLQRIAEKQLNWPVDQIDKKVAELKIQMGNLLTFGD